jgi:DNA-directed RNA polymerase specialized sigma24 family protein
MMSFFLSRIETKLNTMIKLLALSAISSSQPLRDQAIQLQRAGLAPKEIAALCGTTPNTVSVALSMAKKRAGKKRKKATR